VEVRRPKGPGDDRSGNKARERKKRKRQRPIQGAGDRRTPTSRVAPPPVQKNFGQLVSAGARAGDRTSNLAPPFTQDRRQQSKARGKPGDVMAMFEHAEAEHAEAGSKFIASESQSSFVHPLKVGPIEL